MIPHQRLFRALDKSVIARNEVPPLASLARLAVWRTFGDDTTLRQIASWFDSAHYPELASKGCARNDGLGLGACENDKVGEG